jgi:cytochrome c oxidase cbb3-type subunit IV
VNHEQFDLEYHRHAVERLRGPVGTGVRRGFSALRRLCAVAVQLEEVLSGDKADRRRSEFETMIDVISNFVATAWTPIFAAIFLAIIGHALWPGNRRKFDDAASMPLRED